MDKNILAFVNKHSIIYNLKSIVLRILGLFLISYGVIVLVELYSPYGYDSIAFFNENTLPYTITLTITAALFSIADIFLYRIKLQWSFTVTRGLTNLYASILLLIASVMGFDGVNFYFQVSHYTVIKLCVYVIIIPIDIFLLHKIIIPRCEKKKDYSHFASGIIITTVCSFRLMLRTTESVDAPAILSLCAYAYSICLLVNYIYYFSQAYYAKKYSINTVKKIAPIPPRSLHTLK